MIIQIADGNGLLIIISASTLQVECLISRRWSAELIT